MLSICSLNGWISPIFIFYPITSFVLQNGNTALILAAANNKLDIVKYLLDRGADINPQGQVSSEMREGWEGEGEGCEKGLRQRLIRSLSLLVCWLICITGRQDSPSMGAKGRTHCCRGDPTGCSKPCNTIPNPTNTIQTHPNTACTHMYTHARSHSHSHKLSPAHTSNTHALP